ncbi:MAG: trimeric intracellular cation channel family protein [Crocinitomicaceae bacterium]|nr:trimeric intracellular cation channel family protein [Crocinitomicaceae bacterium]
MVLTILDFIGVFVFSMSGLLAASNKKMDVFGGLIIAFVTALGGGTLRDILLDQPIAWIVNPWYIYLVIFGSIAALAFNKVLFKIRKALFLFDSIGIGLFMIIGLQKGLSLELPLITALIFGVITATFGGVIRDTLSNEVPLIFRKEIYATACIAGGLLFIGLKLLEVPETINLISSVVLVTTIRIVVVLKKWRLPLLNEEL